MEKMEVEPPSYEARESRRLTKTTKNAKLGGKEPSAKSPVTQKQISKFTGLLQFCLIFLLFEKYFVQGL